MAKIESREVKRCLDRIREWKQGSSFYDVHVHPFEVLFCDNRPYRTAVGPSLPEVGAIAECPEDERCGQTDGRLKRATMVLTTKRSYRNAGPECFLSHMEMAAVDHSLLLPIAPASGDTEIPMDVMRRLFAREGRFTIGCSVPNTIPVSRIHEFLSRMKSEFHATAVKLHPNITEVDLTAAWGKERVEAILDGCVRSGLSLVIHGGRSSILRNGGARTYGCIANMEDIRWSSGDVTVVIAHGGAYECTPMEVEQEVFPVLARLLSRHPNLLVDLSGLDCENQILLLRRIGPERIVFGSDALYGTPWREAVKLIHSLERAGCKVEESYRMIAGETPERSLFQRKDGHVRGLAHAVASNR